MTRPWVTPGDVKAYTDNPKVADRPDAKLATDIMRAEEYVINMTHNDFSAEEYATTMPNAVKTAIILLAEQYAMSASAMKSKTFGLKSETFDDYSYTAADEAAVSVDALDLGSLLDPYVLTQGSGNVFMRMRKL
ncbi:MAG: DUF3199 family protein [Spirochaetales bacterium]|nr:DUF3199 family protein [Spirochaetales bacterium]